jgi:iron transport multicopper oxidase
MLGIRFEPNFGTLGFDGGLNSAILRYDGADEEEPTTEQTDSTNPLVEANLVPLESPGAVSHGE